MTLTFEILKTLTTTKHKPNNNMTETRQQQKLDAALADAKRLCKIVGWNHEKLSEPAKNGVPSKLAKVRWWGMYILFQLGHTDYCVSRAFGRVSADNARRKVEDMLADDSSGRHRNALKEILGKMRQPKAEAA